MSATNPRLQFDTRHFPVAEARGMWRELFCETVMIVEPEFLEPEKFGVQLAACTAGSLGLIRAEMHSVRHRREARHVARDGDRGATILFADSGQMHCRTPRQLIGVNRNTCAVATHDRPYVSDWHGPTRMVTIDFGEALLDEAGALHDRGYADLPADDPVAKLFRAHVDMIWQLDPVVLQAEGERIERQLAELAVALIARTAGGGNAMATDSRRALAVLDLIAREHRDPALDLAEAARRLNLSPRAIREAMALTGAGFAQTLSTQRLATARAMLARSPARVIDIALGSGFSDVSYFNRLFRARYGTHPSAMRGVVPR